MLLLDSSYWTIQHTPKKGRGVFAQREIDGGLVIGDYLGKIYPDKEAEELEGTIGLYSMSYGQSTSIFPVDVSVAGVHIVNHSCMPNCSQYSYQNRTLYFSLRKIFPGEELTTSYDMEYSDEPSPGSYACFCGTLLCRGTMCVSAEVTKASDAEVAENQQQWMNESRDIHTILTPLTTYPTVIADDPIYDIFAHLEKASHILTETTMPDVDQIRLLLRTHGVPIRFEQMGIDITGVYRGTFLVRKTQ